MELKQYKQTKFDSMVTNKTMQLIKAVIPYINHNYSTLLGVYIKYIELKKAMNVNSNLFVCNDDSKGENDNYSMLNDMKDFLSDEEKENIDTMMMIMEMINSENGDDENLEKYMHLFNNM